MSDESIYGIEMEITLQDSYYYASREAGATFLTKPVLMHTALYYALGLFPSAFRIAKHTPHYEQHRDDSELGNDVYLFPGVATDDPSFTTRRFAVKPDEFRQSSERGSANFKETGHMKMIDPGVTFRTYAVCPSSEIRQQLQSKLPEYTRVGKKLSLARVETTPFEAVVEHGTFSLTHPIADLDIDQSTYSIRGGLEWERMNPVDLITGADLEGPHFKLAGETNNRPTRTLPSELRFLGEA